MLGHHSRPQSCTFSDIVQVLATVTSARVSFVQVLATVTSARVSFVRVLATDFSLRKTETRKGPDNLVFLSDSDERC